MYTTEPRHVSFVKLNGRVSLVGSLFAGRQRLVAFAPLFFQITVLHDPRHVLKQRLERKSKSLTRNVACTVSQKNDKYLRTLLGYFKTNN